MVGFIDMVEVSERRGTYRFPSLDRVSLNEGTSD